MGTLANPVKIIDLTNELKNVEKIRTDMELDDMRYLLEVAKNNTHSLTDSAVLEPKPDGVLQETYDESGRYIIVPRDESWGEVRLFFQDILNKPSE